MHAFKPLSGHQIYAQQHGSKANFTVVSLFTAPYRDKADRLKASLNEVGLNYVIYEVPSVHNSLSPKGGDDITFCKPNFVHAMLQEWGPAILCVDADIVFRKFPKRINQLAKEGVEFAVYNWLADKANDAYAPIEAPLDGYQKNRLYKYSHSVDFFDPNQLINSGAVHFYRRSKATTALLSAWLKNIIEHPNLADDQILDYTFNFGGLPGLKRAWLDKTYCRYAWWLTAKPIIDHPDLAFDRRNFETATGIKTFDEGRAKPRLTPGPFPRNCLIDTEEKQMLTMSLNQMIASPITAALWVATKVPAIIAWLLSLCPEFASILPAL